MISVIMSVYNEKISYLEISINSILRQDYKNIELIIVNDNPNNKLIVDYLKTKCREDTRIKLFINSENLGQAESRNFGVKHSNGKYISIMDADDFAVKYKLSTQIKFMKDNHLDFVFSNFDEMDESGKLITNGKWNLQTTMNQTFLKYIYLNCSDISLQSTWLMKREVFYDLHGYRNLIVEDFDFSLRSIFKHNMQGYQSDILVCKRSRNNGIMQTNKLKIYLTVKYIKKYIKHNNCIPYISYIDSYMYQKYSKYKSIKFDKFILYLHNYKKNKNKKNLMKSFLFLFTTEYSISYIIDNVLIRIKQHVKGI